METLILRTIDELRGIKDDWERIEMLAPQVTYFSSYRLNYDWWCQYDDDDSKRLFVIIAKHNFEIVGIAPLQIVRLQSRGYKYDELQFMHGGGDYSNFIVNPNVSAEPSKIVNELLGQIEAHKDEYDTINLTHISQFSLLAHQLLISKDNNSLQYLIECPYIDFKKYPTFEDYTKSFIPKKTKQYINRFKREVDFRMEVTNRNLIREMGDIHIAEKDYLQSKGLMQRHSFFENPRELKFRDVLYTDNPNTLTYLLRDNKTEEIICYYTGYVFRDIFHSVTTAYNPKYSNLAVGKIFNYMIFEENYQNRRWGVFDMGTGRYAWKFEMTDSFNLLYQFRVENYRGNYKPMINKILYTIGRIKRIIR